MKYFFHHQPKGKSCILNMRIGQFQITVSDFDRKAATLDAILNLARIIAKHINRF